MSDKPTDATGEYQNYNGHRTWIKGLDLSHPDWPMAYVWSFTTKRWRIKRERILMDRVRLFPSAATEGAD